MQLHNTLHKQKESFTPQKPGVVNLYSCGPTVYDYAHIGNFRSFLLSDLLARTLRLNGLEVTKVQNITDVGHLTNDDLADGSGEDKIAKAAKRSGLDAFAVAEKYTSFFLEDEAELRIEPPEHRPKATDFIKEQIELAQTLIDRDYAYEANGSVYFRAEKFAEYGKLSGNRLEDLRAGSRVEVSDEKESPLDFALWKSADPNHLMQWNSPWGRGFPGWHIECSAMSKTLLDHIDIHTGGEDNIFPHHECEIAQNECGYGLKIPYWLHAKHLLVDGEKMSKSKGNFYTIRDLLADGWTGSEIRYALLSTHYRTAFNFTTKALDDARKSIGKLQNAYQTFSSLAGNEVAPTANTQFQLSLNDDLNVSQALAETFALINEGFRARDAGELMAGEAAVIVDFLVNKFDVIFAVLDPLENTRAELPDEVKALLDQRQAARGNEDWAESDRLRDELKSLGYAVIDENGEQRVERI